jgi:hypothetical protein
MSLIQTLTTSFKKELLEAGHNFKTTGDTFRLALYTSSASLNADTTAYTTSNEVVGTGYTAGGLALTNVDPTTGGTVGFADFINATWTTATLTARGALLYNDSHAGNGSVLVLDFGSDRSSAGTDFVVVFPVADAINALVRIT